MKNIFLAFLQSKTNFVSWEFKDDLKLLSNTLRVQYSLPISQSSGTYSTIARCVGGVL